MGDSLQSPFEVSDFSKGILDDPFEQNYSAAAEYDNFVITYNGGLDSRDGSVVDDLVNGQAPSGVARIGALINYANNDTLIVNSGRQLFYRNPSAYSIIRGTSNNEVLSAGDNTSAISYSQWTRHLYVVNDAFSLPTKVFKDDLGAMQVRNNGFDYLATDPVVTPGAVGTGTYLYTFHFHYTYVAGTQEFQDFGPTTPVQILNCEAPNVSAVNISGIPVLTNGLTGNYDLTNVKVFIYRTVDGGEASFKIGEVTNGTTTFVDNFDDTFIQENGLILYTDDGTVDYEAPPLCKYMTIVNSTGYYGSTKEGSEELKNRVRQSVPGIPGAVPGDFYIDVEDEVTGLGSIKSIPLIFCKKHVYRVESAFDRYGRQAARAIRISDTAGNISALSVTTAENYCLWFGFDGVYATDGYQVIKISDSINDRYRDIVSSQTEPNRITGTFNENDRRVYWALQNNSANLDNDSLLVLDMRWGVVPKSTFTTWSGKSFRPSSVAFFNGLLYRGDTRGYVFKHSPDYDTDPRVDILALPSTWPTETIIWSYKSVNINFGSMMNRKSPSRILLQATNVANTSIQIVAISDDGRIVRDLKQIRWRRNFVWGDPEFVWGNPDCVWGGVGLIEQWRRFPAKSLRLSYLQLVITNGYGIVTNSDTDGTATFTGTTNTIVLDDQVNNKWPDNVVGYNIRTVSDGYVREFEVTSRIDDFTITVLDSESLLPTGSLAWELYGYLKGEPLKLIGYNVLWNDVSPSQNTFESGQDGSNA